MKIAEIKKLCCIPTEILHNYLIKELKYFGYTNIQYNSEYIIAEGTYPVCLIAHIDTVFDSPQIMDNFYFDPRRKVLWGVDGSGFDDRAGVCAILEILKLGYRPSVIFTNKEEVGGIGSLLLIQRFPEIPFSDCRCLIQLDRANKNDCVFYNCDNTDFENYICNFGFEYRRGTFSDISILAPAWKIAAVNLSIGYVDEHTYNERLHIDWCNNTISKVCRILDDSFNMPFFEYVEFKIEKYSNILNKKENAICEWCGTEGDVNVIASNYDIIYLCDSCKEQYDTWINYNKMKVPN
jgi:hypothetical protein